MGDPLRMHRLDEPTRDLSSRVFAYLNERRSMNPPPLDKGEPFAELRKRFPDTISEAGIGGDATLDFFTSTLAPATMSTDHPAMVSLIPNAPTEASILCDYIVSASSILGTFWAEGAGAIWAENEVLRLIAREAGFPDVAGGAFVQGGTIGNLSALVAARFSAESRLEREGKSPPARWAFACSEEAHSSLAQVGRVMGVDAILVPVGDSGRMTGDDIERAAGNRRESLFAVVATGGTTNFGIVDDIASIIDWAARSDIWVHVDGAYGLAGLFAESVRESFTGIDRADSFIVDPHKWLYAPYDSCALIYRSPAMARAAHTQHASYLDILTETEEWNPSEFAVHLSRRARGLPVWFSLATHGVGAYRDAIESNIDVAKRIAEDIRGSSHLELVREPMLSIVVFRRRGWTHDDYVRWSDRLWEEGRAVCLPSKFRGEPVLRFAVINPRTTHAVLTELIDSLREDSTLLAD